MTRQLIVIVITLLLPLGMPALAAKDDTRLERQMADYWDAYLKAFPLTAMMYSADAPRDQLDDLSPRALRAWHKLLGRHISQLEKINPARLSNANRDHHAAFNWMLRNEHANLELNSSYLIFTTFSGWHSSLPQIVQALTYRHEQDYRDLIKLLSAVDVYAQQNMDILRQGIAVGYTQPCVSLTEYEASITGYITEPAKSAFAKPFQQFPDTITPTLGTELREAAYQVIDEVINPAYASYTDFWREEYLPACRKKAGLSSLPGGREAYDQALRYFISLETDADSVHALGLKEVERIRQDMQAVIDEVDFAGDFDSFLKFLRTDPQFYAQNEESYLHYIAWVTRTIDSKLPEFFARLPANPYGISIVPEQIAPTTTTAYYQPGAADGTRAGQYFVNTWNLPARPLYEIPALSLHEAVPGHHLQISFQQENKNMPDWRRNHYFHAFGEGWALYTELLGEEMGMYKTPYERFGRMIYEIWRAVRLVVDTGIHAKGWSRQKAIDYMLANTGLTRQNVIAEVDRYITWPGQATAYKHGELKFRELRARAEQQLGQQFDLREFHLALLEGGSMPLTVLEDKIDEWVAARKGVR